MVQGLIGLDYNRGCNEALAYPEVIQQRKQVMKDYSKSDYPVEFIGILVVGEKYILLAIYIHADGHIEEILDEISEDEMANITIEVKRANKKTGTLSI